ncbi:YndM family protein [Virgibacillus sp. W0181]|uniref:YndM family protein n=1 Tax=Virgibacillus sp. W0181 TaxID=3391581 RepID=UPI003F486760
MNHGKAIVIKFIIVSIVICSLFGIFTNVTLSMLFVMSLIVTGVAYFIGDLLLLRKFGNVIATFLDFGLLILSVWMLANLFIDTSMAMLLVSFYVAFIITFTEPLFHGYMQEKVFANEPKFPSSGQLQTEFAEEVDMDNISVENRDDSEK